jgi:hypothetical protein
MTWEDKVEMARLFNNGLYEEAIGLFRKQEDWDMQACDMFVTGMDLSKCELCLPLVGRIQEVQANRLPDFRSQMRWSILQMELEKLTGKESE